jgi:hypothetical protein
VTVVTGDGVALALKTQAEFTDQYSERETQRVIIGLGTAGGG